MTPEEIKALRLRLEWTQEHMARELGVSFPTVNRWEKGKAKPSSLAVQALERLERRAGVQDEQGRDSEPGRQEAAA